MLDRVEQRDRRRLVAAGVLVGVVADDSDARDHAVDAAVELSDSAREIVELAVCLVDPTLECDGEVDEVGAATPEQRLLRRADVAKPAPRDSREHERGERENAGSRSRSRCDRGRHG